MWFLCGSVGPSARLHALLLACRPADPPVHPFVEAAIQNVLDVLNDQVYSNCVIKTKRYRSMSFKQETKLFK